jgi:hypothetical protein
MKYVNALFVLAPVAIIGRFIGMWPTLLFILVLAFFFLRV